MNSQLVWCEINKRNLIDNISCFVNLLGNEKNVLIAVKSNAYGHGLKEVSDIISNHYPNAFLGVNALWEADIIRKNKVNNPILIMGYTLKDQIKSMDHYEGVRFCVYDCETLSLLNDAGKKFDRKIKIHLKLETGLNRQGVLKNDLESLVNKANCFSFIEIEGAYTHFANVEDTTDHSYAKEQINRFREMILIIKKILNKNLITHCACSAAVLTLPESRMDIVRAGISVYGFWSSPETRISSLQLEKSSEIILKPVLSLKTRIAQVKRISAGEKISYGCTDQTTGETLLAVLPVGYYDGYNRNLSSVGQVIIRGQRAFVRGRICMNMMMVDVTHIKGIQKEDEVVLIGESGNEKITADFIASQTGSINYEVVTGIRESIRRFIV